MEAMSSGRRGAYHHGNLRDALLDAAEGELLAVGPEALSLRRIARQCGVSQTAPYRHFATRDGLLVALATRAFDDFAAALRSAGRKETEPWPQLRALGRAYFDYAQAHPQRLRLMFGRDAVLRNADPALLRAAEGAFDILSAAVGNVLGDEPELDPTAAAFAAWGLAHGLAAIFGEAPGSTTMTHAERERIVDAALEILGRGLRGAAD